MKASGMRRYAAVLVVLVVALMGISVVAAGNVSARPVSSPSTSASSASSAAPPAAAASASIASNPAYTTPAAGGPHPGTLDVYELAPGGTTTLDPAVAYYTVPDETITNVYETLVAFNGTQTGPAPENWTPQAAACTPGSALCGTLFSGPGAGNDLVFANATTGNPQYYTFVIDGTQQFYDPTTQAHWGLYPSDVMFSLSRTMSFGNLPGVGWFNGWIQEQWALPFGNSTWDGGIHYPWNNTPYHILSSMLVNDSAYCPAAAMTGAYNGCITFNVGPSGLAWPYFLELIGDPLGAAVTPCGWFTAQGASLPGWAGTSAANGDGPCLLPGGATSTNSTAFQSFLTNPATGGNATYWDAVQSLAAPAPTTPQQAVQYAAVGSGPYYLVPGSSSSSGGPGGAGGYTLGANPNYIQPAACTGVTGGRNGCLPPVGEYIPNVVVYYENQDTAGLQAMIAGTADTAGFDVSHTSTVLQLVNQGTYSLLRNVSGGSANWFMAYEENVSVAGEKSVDPTNKFNVPGDFLANTGLRNFLSTAYPYTTIQNTVWTVDGLQTTVMYGGAIPPGQASYYPANVSWPYLQGDPNTNPSVVDGAAWWWAQITNASNTALFDSELNACTAANPCQWPIVGWVGAPSLDNAIKDWISEISSLSGGRLVPYSYDLTGAGGFYAQVFKANGLGTLPIYNWGWIQDYADPTDWFIPMWQPNGTFTLGMAVAQLSYLSQFNSPTCGHTAGSSTTNLSNLIYWANYPDNAIPTDCSGVAYNVMLHWLDVGAVETNLPFRTLIYNLVEHIGNELSFMQYTYVNLANFDYGSWLSPSGINTNPSQGPGGVQTWYTWTYASNVFNVQFTESGLSSGTSWSVTLAGQTKTSTSTTITFTGETNGSYPYTVAFVPGFAASPSNGTLDISGSSASVAVTFTAIGTPTYPLTFSEQGLVSNTKWAVTVVNVGTQVTTQPSMTFNLTAGNYSYAPGAVLGFKNSGPNTTTLAAPSTTVTVTYTSTSASTFNVAFVETGLIGLPVSAGPNGTLPSWAVTMSGVTYAVFNGTEIDFTETNGTYPFTILVPAGYSAPAASGVVTVAGADVTVSVAFTTPGSGFPVTFSQTGLPSGASWTVWVNGFGQTSTGASAVFTLPNGTYNWTVSGMSGYFTTTPSGTVTVNGSAAQVAITYQQFTYPVTFFEGGLAAGTDWNVTVNGNTYDAAGSYFVTVDLPNGSFAWTVGAPSGYTPSPASGTIVVSAGPATQVVIFAPTPTSYSVTFTESGLPSGGSWTVYMNGQHQSSSSSTIVFSVPNGTYTFTVVAPSGTTATSSATGNTISVSGASVSVSVTIATAPSGGTGTNQNFLGTLAYSLIGVLAVLAIIFLVLAVYFARRKPPMATPPQSWSGSQGDSSQQQSPPQS